MSSWRHGLGLAALAAWCAPALAPVAPVLGPLFGIRTRRIDGKGVALTFDDGPHAQGTPAVLDLLARANARATFFLVGEQVARRPTLAAEIAAAGHEIALHGYRHTLLLRRTPQELAGDLDRAMATIAEATGVEPSVYRPPYGVFSAAGLWIARRRGLAPWLWSDWGRDWTRKATPEGIVRLTTRNLRAGGVVLLHDADFYSSEGSWSKTVSALPAILDVVLSLGEPLLAVSDST